jgi:hypothetical protein
MSNGFDLKFEPGSRMFNLIKWSIEHKYYKPDTVKLVKRVINLDRKVLKKNEEILLCFMDKFEIV